MSINQYLKQKYGMDGDAKVPTSFLLEELHIQDGEVRQLVCTILNRKTFPSWITFEAFTLICTECLEA